MEKIAFLGVDKYLVLFFKMLGVSCFSSINEIDPKQFAVVLVQENLLHTIDIRKYLGKLLIFPAGMEIAGRPAKLTETV